MYALDNPLCWGQWVLALGKVMFQGVVIVDPKPTFLHPVVSVENKGCHRASCWLFSSTGSPLPPGLIHSSTGAAVCDSILFICTCAPSVYYILSPILYLPPPHTHTPNTTSLFYLSFSCLLPISFDILMLHM